MPMGLTLGGKGQSVPPDSVRRLAAVLKTLGRVVLVIEREETGHSTNYADGEAVLEFVIGKAAAAGSVMGKRTTKVAVLSCLDQDRSPLAGVFLGNLLYGILDVGFDQRGVDVCDQFLGNRVLLGRFEQPCEFGDQLVEAGERVLQEAGVISHELGGRVDFVGYPSRQLADRLQFLRPRQFALHVLAFDNLCLQSQGSLFNLLR